MVKPASCSSCAGALGVGDDETDDAVLGGLRRGEAADVDAGLAEDVGHLGETTAAVLEEHGELRDLHDSTSWLATAARPSSNARRLTSRILAGTAASRPRRHVFVAEREHGGGGAEQRDVDGAQGARLAGETLGVHGEQAHAAPRRGAGQVVRVVLLAAQHAARRDARGGRADQRAARPQQAEAADALEQLGGDDDVGVRRDRRPHVLAEAHRAEHAAAALRHALDLAGLDLEAGRRRRLGEDRGAEQDALAADPDERDGGRAVHDSPPAALEGERLRWHTSTHRPQPVHGLE